MATKYNKLAQALTDDQREALRQKIDVYLCRSDDLSRNIIQRKSDEKQRSVNAAMEMNRAGLGTKMNVWMRGLLSTKGGSEAFVNMKMEALRGSILGAQSDLLDIATRTLKPAFAEAVFELYGKLASIIPVLNKLFREGNLLEGMIISLMHNRIPGLKIQMTDFMNIEEMKAVYMSKENKGELIDEGSARLEKYLGELNDQLFDQLVEGVSPIYYYWNLANFEYRELFRAFAADVNDAGGAKPVFHGASGVENVGLLEKFFYSIYPFIKAREAGKTHFTLFSEAVEYLVGMKGGRENAETEENSRQEVAEMQRILIDVFAAVETFDHKIPLASIIRYIRNDPYYKMLIYFPKLKLRQYYETAMRLKVFSEIDKSFPGIRLGIIEMLIGKLFKDQSLKAFEFYRSSAPAVVAKLGLPTFTYFRSLNIMLNFIVLHYYGYVQELIHNLNRISAVRSREDLTRMLLHAAAIEDLADGIRKFDQAFSPESPEGKSFYRMRYALEKETTQQKNYRSFIGEKDQECRLMLERGMEHGSALVSIFNNILSDKKIVLRERLLNLRSAQVVSRRYDEVLKQAVDSFGLAFKIIRQLMRIEEGA